MSAAASRAAADPAGSSAYAPGAPRTVEDTGLPFVFLAGLACKILLLAGPQRLGELAARLALPAGVCEPLVEFLRRERLAEVASHSTGSAPIFTLTDRGRERAESLLRLCGYGGPAPVPLAAYVEQVRRQAIADLVVTQPDMERAFAGVVVRPELLEQLGAAMNSGRAILLHGPAGAGKTFIAEHLAGLLAGEVYIPHAILAGAQVIQVYDPHTHARVQQPRGPADGFLRGAAGDARWVACHRPAVLTGGELTLDLLDLQFDASARFYSAPPQVKANNGLLIIDDLGRQRVSARELMNRWIVPLDRRIDYLALHTGEKYLVPFDVTVVFSTNFAPAELADEAFLRRLGYKIGIGGLDEAQYRTVCRQVCEAGGLPYEERIGDYLVARLRAEGRPLLACTPRDVLGQARDRARFVRQAAPLGEPMLDWAWDNYFVRRPAGATHRPEQTS